MSTTPRTAVTVTFWSRAGQHRADPALRSPQPRPAALRLAADGRFYAGRLAVPATGTVALSLVSPRPLRLWLDGVLVLDEPLFWRHFQRRLYAAVLCPCAAGEVPFLVEVGPRPRHPEHIDRDCASRNRERVMRELARRIPDALTLTGAVTPAVTLPALSLCFRPAQCRRDGAVWQHVYVRPARGVGAAPSVNAWSPAEEPQPQFCLTGPAAPGAAVESTPEAERQAGLRRLLVPVADSARPLPPLRTTGPDPRVEPAVEAAGSVTLTVAAPGGAVQLPMPLFESLGRLAPQREFRRIEWPAPETLRAAVPEPVLPEEWAHFRKLYDATWEMLLGLVRHPDPASGLPGAYVATGAGFVHHQFVWDSSFTALCTAYGWRALDAHATLNLLYSRQFDGGYIHREHDVRDGLPAMYEPDFSPNPPIMTLAEWALFQLTGNARRLAAVYPALKANHAWLRHNRRLPDGTYWTTGLANGLDNSPSLGDGYPCLTAQMAHEAETLAAIATALGLPRDAAAFRAEHAAVGRACNARLWSRELEIYSTSLPGGGHNPNKVVTAFWPLWAGIVPAPRVEALARHLKDPASFWRHHPLPSLAADSPHFQPEGNYWLGSTWAPTNFAAIKGFDRAGRHDLAVETTLRHLQCMYEVWAETGKIWENYCSEASRRGNWSGPNYCWSALGPIALLLEVLLGLAPAAPAATLAWNPPPGKALGVRRYPLGPATISLLQGRDWQGHWGIDVETDRPFTLVLRRDDHTVTHACPVGHTHLPL